MPVGPAPLKQLRQGSAAWKYVTVSGPGKASSLPSKGATAMSEPARRRSPSPPRDTPSTVAWQSRWNREARCRERGIEPQQRAYQSPLGLATGAYKQGSAASSSSTDLYKTGHLVEGSCTLKKQGRSAALFWSASQLSRERLVPWSRERRQSLGSCPCRGVYRFRGRGIALVCLGWRWAHLSHTGRAHCWKPLMSAFE